MCPLFEHTLFFGLAVSEAKGQQPTAKAAIKREQNDACINYAECEQARPQVKVLKRLGLTLGLALRLITSYSWLYPVR